MEHLLSAINEIENPLVTESRNHGGLSAFRLLCPQSCPNDELHDAVSSI